MYSLGTSGNKPGPKSKKKVCSCMHGEYITVVGCTCIYSFQVMSKAREVASTELAATLIQESIDMEPSGTSTPQKPSNQSQEAIPSELITLCLHSTVSLVLYRSTQ